MHRPWDDLPTVECGEPLVPLPETVVRWQPHPYQVLGAPYGDCSPWQVRQGLAKRLAMAQQALAQECPGWSLRIYDAYRPLAVQTFMVDYACQQVATMQGTPWSELSAAQRAAVQAQVAQFWALPDPERAPPHSTGAAVDVTLQDATGQVVDMGGVLDEVSPRSFPDFYAGQSNPLARAYHQHRQKLCAAMHAAGFVRHPNEWWHFAWGDRLWAYVQGAPAAVYGRADLLC
ncbi:MAG: M15 family metallopeptidase [Pseudanabaenaceae cyanobacterium]